MNDKIYIHELVDIIGHNRARYMHHMTANWVPTAISERNQRCFGVWGTVGSTGRWPEVVNIWELDGWEGLAANFAHELSHPTLQDPALSEWWAAAAELRRGGFDRICVPAPFSPPVDELVAGGVKGTVYAHELLTTSPGAAEGVLRQVGETARPMVENLGLQLVAAFSVAMGLGTEAIVVWAIPDWETWVAYERAFTENGALCEWRRALIESGVQLRRTLMVEAPLSPLRLGRQPEVGDRRPLAEV